MQQQYKQINQLKINLIMVFVIKSSPKPYKLSIKIHISKTNFTLKFQFVLTILALFFKPIFKEYHLKRFKRIETNYLYIYQTNFI